MAKHSAEGPIAFVGETGDGRLMERYEFRQFPLTLRAVFTQLTGGGGHNNAEVVGKLVSAQVLETGEVWARVEFADTEAGAYAARLVNEEALPGISIDGADIYEFEIRYEIVTESGEVLDVSAMPRMLDPEAVRELRIRTRVVYERIVIGAATLVSVPAFPNARLKYTGEGFDEDEGRSVTSSNAEIAASALPTYPWQAFELRKTGFDRLTAPDFENFVADDGQTYGMCYGHMAPWDVEHLASIDTGKPIVLRREDFDLSQFNSGVTLLDNGEKVFTGYITVGQNHARAGRGGTHPGRRSLRAQDLIDHYDRSDSAGAVITTWPDDFGVAFCGIVKPDADVEQMRQVMECGPSVHSKRINGTMTLFGVLAVPIEGFPVARGQGDHMEEIAASWFGAGQLEAGDGFSVKPSTNAQERAAVKGGTITLVRRLTRSEAVRQALEIHQIDEQLRQ
jgi:hypothetical protein